MTLDRRRFLHLLAAGAAGAAASACGATTASGPPAAGGTGTTGAPATTGASPATTPGSSAAPATTAAPAMSTTAQVAPTTDPGPPTGPSTSAGPDTTPPPTTAPGGPAPFVARGPDGPPRVALTFHTNGDLALAEKLLRIVESRRVPITAFVIGNWLDANPRMAGRLLDGGHELANHTYTHPAMAQLGAAAVASEITRCRDTLARLSGGKGGRWFRPSGFDDGTVSPSTTVLTEAGRAGYQAVIGFDVDPYDYRDPGADAVRTRTLATVRAGSIVSLHFGHPGTVDALPGILDGIAARQLQPVTLSTLFG